MRIDIAGYRAGAVGSVIGGSELDERDPLGMLTIKSRETFELAAPTRAAEPLSFERRSVSGETLVEIEWADGLTWITRADVLARDLGPLAATSAQIPTHETATAAAVTPSSVLRVDAGLGQRTTLRPEELTRGLPEDAAHAVENAQALRGETPDGPKRVTLLVAEAISELGGQVITPLLRAFEGRALKGEPGLYRLNTPHLLGDPVRPNSLRVGADLTADTPLLVMIHGTASSTEGTFGDLDDTQCWAMLKAAYGTNIAAFEHRSLSHDPIQNAIDLARVVPKGACIDLLTHSRGGLVGDLLVAGARAESFVGDSRDPNHPAELRSGLSSPEVEAIRELSRVISERALRVGRFVRVAAPSRGTLLLSKRLDTYLNLALTALSFVAGQSPLVLLVKSLVRALVRAAASPGVIPGLACMRPDSPLIALLNRAEAADRSALAIVAGDARRAGLLGRLRTLIPDLYFRAQHDLVVDTDSMYRGVRRNGEVHEAFHRDQSRRRIHHFSYFGHAEIQLQIANYLAKQDTSGLELMDRPRMVTRGLHGIGEIVGLDRGLEPPPRRSDKPTVILIPGIMGSHLSEPAGGDRIWVALSALMLGGMERLAHGRNVGAHALVDRAYGRLTRVLAENWDVILFPFDWRLSVETAGEQLGTLIEQELKARERTIHVLAHSMGGLVARAMIAKKPHLWSRLGMASGRLVMLGTPNHGSYIIPKLLLGRESLLSVLDFVDRHHDKGALLDILRPLPGIYDMLPVQDIDAIEKNSKQHAATEFFTHDFWKKLLPLHAQEMVKNLARAAALRDSLRSAVDPSRMVYVAGKDRATPYALTNGALVGTGGNDDEPFRYTKLGDGRVTWRQGRLPGVPTYYCEVAHGDLADAPKIFHAIFDLLRDGHTDRLPQTGGLRAAAAAETDFNEAAHEAPKPRPPDAPDLFPDERDVLAQALGGYFQSRELAEEHAIELRFYHADHLDKHMGDDPILIGHYYGSWFGQLEERLDRKLGGALRRHISYGVHPGQIGTSSVVNSLAGKGPTLIVIGLGDSGNLSPSRLALSVRNGLLRYISNGCAAECATDTDGLGFRPIDVRTTLLGTGRGGLSRRASLLAIVEGAIQANRRLREQGEWDRVRIRRITFADHVAQLMLTAVHEACAASTSPPFHLEPSERIAVDTVVQTARPGSDYWLPSSPDERGSGSRWQGITVIADNVGRLRYFTQGGRARADTIDTFHSPRSLDACIAELARAEVPDDGLIRFLLGYLLPDQLRPVFREGVDLLLSLDMRAAGVPWELFLRDPDVALGAPVTRLSIVRQLRTNDRAHPALQASSSGRALVLGESNPGNGARQLDGVGRELDAVERSLKSVKYEVTKLSSSGPRAVWSALGRGSYEIVHLAGHGFFDRKDRKGAGLMLQDQHVLGARELAVCDQPPSLLFVNACDLGHMDGKSLADPLRMAANFAEACIERGVLAVVVAGWKIQDDAAAAFAREFYARMLQGDRLVEAVGRARLMAFRQSPTANTWAAFQCYGDPEFALPSVMDGTRAVVMASRDMGAVRLLSSTTEPSIQDRCRCWVHASEVEDELRRIRRAVEEANRDGDFAALAQHTEALSDLDRSLPIRFRVGPVLFRLGWLWGELSRRDLAIAAYKEASKHSDCPLAVHDALKELQGGTAVAATPTEKEVASSGVQHRELRRKKALKRLEESVRADGVSRRVRVQLATIAWLEGSKEKAQEHLVALDNEKLSAEPQKVIESDILADPEELLLRHGLEPDKVSRGAVRSQYEKTVFASDLRSVAASAVDWLRLLRAIAPSKTTSRDATGAIEEWTSFVKLLLDQLRTVTADPEDPQRGRWGGQSNANGRSLSAHVTPTDDDEWFDVRLVVKGATPDTVLPDGTKVRFHLHPTFATPVEDDVVNGEAVLTLRAYGAFTVGAELDDPYTQLELDLSELADAPLTFKQR